MADAATFTVRPCTAEDSRTCFGIFRESLHDLLRRTGYSDRPSDAEERWPDYEPIFAHLAATGDEWWIAEDEDGTPIGYARSTERNGLIELTEFFVDPARRVGGVGRALLERAFAPGRGTHRSIIATQDAPAVALYLRFGVSVQATAAGFAGRPGRAEPGPGLDVEQADVDLVLEMEREVLGHRRPEDISYIASSRPGVVVRREGTPIGYAFLPDAKGNVGPIAAREPEDLPALLAIVERAAHDAGHEEVEYEVPLTATRAVEYLLTERRFRLDPFYVLLLADGPWAKFDRYLPFNPCLIL